MLHEPIPPRDRRQTDPLPKKGLLGRVTAVRDFFLHPPEPDPLLCGTDPAEPDLTEHVGRFLAVSGLETAHDHGSGHPLARTGGDGGAVRMATESLPSADRPADEAELTTEQIALLIGGAQAAVRQVDGIVRQSGADARAYGEALESGVRDFDRADAARSAEALIAITRIMIDRVQRAESRLHDMSSEIVTLQDNLAEARSLATRDTLTGLPNRAALEERLNEAVAQASRLQRPLALAYCDVDHFKRINDDFGHAVGDRVLRLVADALADGERRGAFVGRYGGEEFLMMFEGLTAGEAAQHVDSIRDMLAQRNLRLRESDRPIGQVTFSAGVAPLMAGDATADMIARADGRLLDAKRAGRNRVEWGGTAED